MSISGYGTNTKGTKSVSLDFKRKRSSDKLEDDVVSELTRRLIGTIEDDPESDQGYVRSATAPSDTTVLWQPVNVDTGINEGPIYTYNPLSQSWEPSGLTSDDIPDIPTTEYDPVQCGEITFSASGSKAITLNNEFSAIPVNKISFAFTPIDSDPGSVKWYVTNRSNGQITLVADGAISLSYLIKGEK